MWINPDVVKEFLTLMEVLWVTIIIFIIIKLATITNYCYLVMVKFEYKWYFIVWN